MIKRLESLKILLINIWPTYDQIDLPVRTEAGHKSTTRFIIIFMAGPFEFLEIAQNTSLATNI
jgi:hypothetical protein